ncbi:phosphatidylethanolamine-binding protein 4-like [Physella acuta]|uniref:phosphatidylethanolamine-binding protein 4-like n=1 Tax=Physella acuta TaxID=109671 RepID=UPI0027DE8451|nr:phosphatidylethanolamine-binding protein 4-like [Physella acuta]
MTDFNWVTLVTLTLAVLADTTDQKLEEELKCLHKKPSDQCDISVTFPEPLGRLTCDDIVSVKDGKNMSKLPEFKVMGSNPSGPAVLLIFDPDAPVSNDPRDGYIHLMAQASIDKEGKVTITKTFIQYTPPAPPVTNAAHRYQVFVYPLPPGTKIKSGTDRKFQLCLFVLAHHLGQPTSAFQFRYKSS